MASADPAAFAHPPVFCAHVASSPFLTTTTMSSAIRALRHISLSSSRAFAVHGAARSVSRAAFPVFAARAGPAASRSFSVSARRFGEGACESFSACFCFVEMLTVRLRGSGRLAGTEARGGVAVREGERV